MNVTGPSGYIWISVGRPAGRRRRVAEVGRRFADSGETTSNGEPGRDAQSVDTLRGEIDAVDVEAGPLWTQRCL